MQNTVQGTRDLYFTNVLIKLVANTSLCLSSELESGSCTELTRFCPLCVDCAFAIQPSTLSCVNGPEFKP